MKINLKLFICLLVGLVLISSLIVVFSRKDDITDLLEPDVTTTVQVDNTVTEPSVTTTVQNNDSDPVVDPDFPDVLEGTFLFDQTIDCSYEAFQVGLFDIDFINNGKTYDQIIFSTCSEHSGGCYCMVYINGDFLSNGTQTLVYCDTDGWRSVNYRNINISSGQT